MKICLKLLSDTIQLVINYCLVIIILSCFLDYSEIHEVFTFFHQVVGDALSVIAGYIKEHLVVWYTCQNKQQKYITSHVALFKGKDLLFT